MKTLMTVCLVAASLMAPAAEETVRARRAIKWNQPEDTWQEKRHLECLSAAKNGGAKVVFLGDSITQFWENRMNEWNENRARRWKG